MVIAQWLERGLGQIFAPDQNYEAQPDHMDTTSSFWQMTAPDPSFAESPVKRPPLQAFNHGSSSDFTPTKEEEAPKTVFLSPTPAKRKKRTEGSSSTATLLVSSSMKKERDHQILSASEDTFNMKNRNSKYREQALKLLQYCSSSRKLEDKALEKVEKLLKIDSERTEITGEGEPSLLYCRSYTMGASCPDGFTPLMAAAMSNQVAAAKLLLRHAKDQQELLCQTNFFGQTPLHIASHYGQVEMIEYLQGLNSGEGSPSCSSSPRNQLEETEDVSGLTALGAGLISPAPKAIKNRALMKGLFSPGVPPSQRKRSLTHSINHLNVKFATAHSDGERVLNEDALMCTPLEFCQGMLFVVCDGHGDCGSVADFIAQQLPKALEQAHDPAAEKKDAVYWTNLCQKAAMEMDAKLENAYLAGGSTAVWMIVTDSLLVVANVGDSRCILVHKDGVMALSEDHKPDLPGEKSRIEEAGLEVIHETYTEKSEGDQEERTVSIPKVKLSDKKLLGTSRAFGDFEYKKSDTVTAAEDQAVVATPDVNCVQRVPDRDEYVVLACDGVWDVQTNDAVAQFVKTKNGENNHDLAATGKALLEECLHSGDNLSVIIVSFEPREPCARIASQDTTSLTPEISKLNLSPEHDEEEDGVKVETPDVIAAKALDFASPEKTTK